MLRELPQSRLGWQHVFKFNYLASHTLEIYIFPLPATCLAAIQLTMMNTLERITYLLSALEGWCCLHFAAVKKLPS
jgi:hypothetical protein